MNELTRAQIVEWFRAQAVKFNEMANTVEKTFRVNGSLSLNLPTTPPAFAEEREVVLAQIRMTLAERPKRLGWLSQQFGVSKHKLKKALQADEKIEVNKQGWVKLIENN